MRTVRVVFMGTAALSCNSLKHLIDAPGCEVAAVVTQPDRPKGRDMKLQASPVKLAALEARLTVLQPERARDQGFVDAIRALQPDLIAVAAYGQILSQSLLDVPAHGCLNVHTSLLPQYRGAAPIQWAILNGDPETGVTIMKMEAGLDTGPILSQVRTPIAPEDNASTLHDRLAEMGAELLVKTIPEWIAGRVAAQPQPATGATYAPKITKQDGEIDWSQSARSLWNRLRALVPWPGLFTFFGPAEHRRLLKVWEAGPSGQEGNSGEVLHAGKEGILVGCGKGKGSLLIKVLQIEGSRRMNAQEFLAGHPLKPGDRLG